MLLTNPFLQCSTLPYQAPQFDQIKECHYRPAFDEGVRQKQAEIAAIAQNPQVPDFANTLLALEQSGALLTRVTSVFFAMTAASACQSTNCLISSTVSSLGISK